MSKIWDEREKSLEEEYFHRKEKELIEKLHAKREEEQRKKAQGTHCPRCDGTLEEITHEGVKVDRCNKCHGVWLDAGELERLTSQEEHQGWLSRLWQILASK